MSSARSAICRGDGFQFDQLAFVGSQVRNEKAQNFARLFRQSQMYEVFINERLKLASQDYKTSDNFERKVLINSVEVSAACTSYFACCCRRCSCNMSSLDIALLCLADAYICKYEVLSAVLLVTMCCVVKNMAGEFVHDSAALPPLHELVCWRP